MPDVFASPRDTSLVSYNIQQRTSRFSAELLARLYRCILSVPMFYTTVKGVPRGVILRLLEYSAALRPIVCVIATIRKDFRPVVGNLITVRISAHSPFRTGRHGNCHGVPWWWNRAVCSIHSDCFINGLVCFSVICLNICSENRRREIETASVPSNRCSFFTLTLLSLCSVIYVSQVNTAEGRSA